MELETLYLTKETYGTDKGLVKGSISFRGSVGKIELVLTHENAQEILRICADRLVEQSKEAAMSMTAAIFESVGTQLEDKSAAAIE